MIANTVLALALAATPAEIEARIERVVSGLLPETAVRNRFGPKATLKERMAYHHTPGIGIAVIHDGRVEWARGFGVRERGGTKPVTEATLFQAGSISKPVFALAVMRLVEEGKLDLDEDVNRYLTSWKVPATGAWQPRVTLRQILGHSAGLTVHGFPGYTTTEPRPSVVDVLNGRPPSNTPAVLVNILPGVQFRYAGGGTTVAQQLVMDLMGKPFPRIMRELVLDPLEMRSSTYEQPLPPDRARVAATAHPWKGVPLEGKWHVYPEMAAAGLWTTPSDLARAGVEVQKALLGESKRVLSAKSVVQMLTPSAASEDVGIGFFLEGKERNVRFGHGGWDEGFVADMTVYKDLGLGAVVMINSNEGHPLIGEIRRAVATEYGWPGYFDEEKGEAAVSTEALDAYVGRYEAKSGFACTVSKENARLFLAPSGQPPLELRPESDTKFSSTALNLDVTFDKAADGIVKGLTLSQAGRQTSAERK